MMASGTKEIVQVWDLGKTTLCRGRNRRDLLYVTSVKANVAAYGVASLEKYVPTSLRT